MSSIYKLLLILLSLSSILCSSPPGAVTMKIVNRAGVNIDLYWNNHFAKKVTTTGTAEMTLVKQPTSPIHHNNETFVKSFYSHQFVLRVADKTTTETDVIITKTKTENEIFIITFDNKTNKLVATTSTTTPPPITTKEYTIVVNDKPPTESTKPDTLHDTIGTTTSSSISTEQTETETLKKYFWQDAAINFSDLKKLNVENDNIFFTVIGTTDTFLNASIHSIAYAYRVKECFINVLDLGINMTTSSKSSYLQWEQKLTNMFELSLYNQESHILIITHLNEFLNFLKRPSPSNQRHLNELDFLIKAMDQFSEIHNVIFILPIYLPKEGIMNSKFNAKSYLSNLFTNGISTTTNNNGNNNDQKNKFNVNALIGRMTRIEVEDIKTSAAYNTTYTIDSKPIIGADELWYCQPSILYTTQIMRFVINIIIVFICIGVIWIDWNYKRLNPREPDINHVESYDIMKIRLQQQQKQFDYNQALHSNKGKDALSAEIKLVRTVTQIDGSEVDMNGDGLNITSDSSSTSNRHNKKDTTSHKSSATATVPKTITKNTTSATTASDSTSLSTTANVNSSSTNNNNNNDGDDIASLKSTKKTPTKKRSATPTSSRSRSAVKTTTPTADTYININTSMSEQTVSTPVASSSSSSSSSASAGKPVTAGKKRSKSVTKPSKGPTE